jgi:hypothetical protein
MFVRVFDDEGRCCTFYTVSRLEEGISETDDFILRMRKEPAYLDQLKMLMSLIVDVIGDVTGADDKYFTRIERKATAFPPKNNRSLQAELMEVDTDFEGVLLSRLRLYSLKLSDSVVVLFNGGIKLTDGAAQDDPNVKVHFRNAQQYAQKITDAIRDGMVEVHDKRMMDWSGEEEFPIF